MARVQLVIADDEQAQFLRQAQLEGLSLSAWLLAAARERIERMRPRRRFLNPVDLAAFFAACDAAESTTEIEPDWEAHKQAIAKSQQGGLPIAST